MMYQSSFFSPGTCHLTRDIALRTRPRKARAQAAAFVLVQMFRLSVILRENQSLRPSSSIMAAFHAGKVPARIWRRASPTSQR